MDTFDTIDAGVFLLVILLIAARLTFWKRKEKLLTLRTVFGPFLLCAISVLDFSAWHHWNAPHRRTYQFILACSTMAVGCGQLALTLHSQKREADRKKQLLGQIKQNKSKT